MSLISVAVAGDCMPSRGGLVTTDPTSAALQGVLAGADFAVANLETLVSGWDGSPGFDAFGGHQIGPPALIDDMRVLGFDAVGCANNHALDMGVGGLLAAMAALRDRRMPFAGVGRDLAEARMPAYLDGPAGSLALLSCTASFAAGAQAAPPSALMRGRPGISPLRHHTIVEVTSEQLAALRHIEAATGMAAQREAADALVGAAVGSRAGSVFAGHVFREADVPGRLTVCDLGDVLEIAGWVTEARQRADVVLVSVHSHEHGGTVEQPAAFLRSFARLIINAGADIVAAHGPHLLRGMEVYRGRPVFYSLGNFVSQIDLAERVPGEDIAKAGGSTAETAPGEFFARRSHGNTVLFGGDRRYWETVLPVISFDDGGCHDVTLYPVSLGFGLPVRHRGRPSLAVGERGEAILASFAALSAEFDTKVTVTAGPDPTGVVETGPER